MFFHFQLLENNNLINYMNSVIFSAPLIDYAFLLYFRILLTNCKWFLNLRTQTPNSVKFRKLLPTVIIEPNLQTCTEKS